MINQPFSIDDFDENDFSDPIALLSAMHQLSTRIDMGNVEDTTDGLITISDIQEQYHIPVEIIQSALSAGTISPAKIVLYFDADQVNSLIQKAGGPDPLATAFERELHKMAMNYSYKPILLLSLLSSDSFEKTVDAIIDDYFDFYQKRILLNQNPEKADSSFVQHPGDRKYARKTILTYPVAVLVKKSFVKYEKSTDTVKLNPLLVGKIYVSQAKEQCHIQLNRYYELL